MRPSDDPLAANQSGSRYCIPRSICKGSSRTRRHQERLFPINTWLAANGSVPNQGPPVAPSFYRVFPWLSLVFLRFTRAFEVLLGLLGFTRFYWVLLGFTEFYRLFRVFLDLIRFYRTLLDYADWYGIVGGQQVYLSFAASVATRCAPWTNRGGPPSLLMKCRPVTSS